MLLQYREIRNTKTELLAINVLLEGKIVGNIEPVKDGYQYFPKGKKIGGKIFSSIELVKKSLK